MKPVIPISTCHGLPATEVFQAGPVDVKSAVAQTIAKSLNGIGIVKARTILAYRDEHSRFGSTGDLRKAEGIGAGTIEQNRKDMRLGAEKSE